MKENVLNKFFEFPASGNIGTLINWVIFVGDKINYGVMCCGNLASEIFVEWRYQVSKMMQPFGVSHFCSNFKLINK